MTFCRVLTKILTDSIFEDIPQDILLPVRANKLSAAEKQCNRLLKNSVGPYFRIGEDHASLFDRLKNLPKSEGFKEMCWFGGRVLIWLPYRKTAGTTTWNHVIDGSELVFDKTISISSPPSAEIEKNDKCLRWYAGPVALWQGSPKSCDKEASYDWSPCVSGVGYPGFLIE